MEVLGPILGSVLSPILGGVGNDLTKKLTGSTNAPFVPEGLGMADKNWQQMYGSYWDALQGVMPALSQQLQSAFQGAQAGTPGMQQALMSLAGMTPQMMQQLMGQANTARQAQAGLMGAGQDMWNRAQDPQNALKQQYMQQVTDASRAGTSMRGIGMGAQAAGLENQATSQFQNAWEAQRQANMRQALAGMTGAFQQAGAQGQQVGQNLTGALGIGAMGPEFMQQSYQYPFNVANMFGQSMGQDIYNPLGYGMNLGIPYMNQGVGATGQNYWANQNTAAGMGAGFDTLMKMFGGQGGGGNYSGEMMNYYTPMYSAASGAGDPGY